uniref:Uncharacterized protein n=1 Tax=viral metagenome TaxID=1070528 RepID=A0A6C0K6Y1_9ZZZZ
MDLLVLILILLSGYIIKYLIDTINTLNNEIREIKMKCISGQKDVRFDNKPEFVIKPEFDSGSTSATTANAALIKNIAYFKDYFDDK